MGKKVIKYILSALLVAFLLYNSVYFRKLDEVKAATPSAGFDAASFARNFYDNKLLPRADSAVELSQLIPLLKNEPSKAFNQYSHALAIGNIRYFLVRGDGLLSSIDDDAVIVQLNDPDKTAITIATEFVYGNAIRDASGLVNLNEFTNTAEFNDISENINKIIRKEVLPPFVSTAKQGDNIKFTGAIELNQIHIDLNRIEVVPIKISTVK